MSGMPTLNLSPNERRSVAAAINAASVAWADLDLAARLITAHNLPVAPNEGEGANVAAPVQFTEAEHRLALACLKSINWAGNVMLGASLKAKLEPPQPVVSDDGEYSAPAQNPLAPRAR